MALKRKKLKISFDLSKLSESELEYFEVMLSGTPCYIRGIPGSAKSAIGRSICAKVIWCVVSEEEKRFTGLNYIDLRLSDKDETDLGSYPVTKNPIEQLLKFGELLERGYINIDDFNIVKDKYLKVIVECDDVTSLSFAVPDWALAANVYPTIIHVEELNRCDQKVRNAALQLLNEKQIGNFKFNDNVFWMCSGNLGESDRTEVDEMDLALSNRVCILDHELTVPEWCENFAFENVWSVIIDYLTISGLLYQPPASDEIRYATARSWTNLSNYILTKFGDDPDIAEIIASKSAQRVGLGFIGKTWIGFAQYLTETSAISIKDIINKLPTIKIEVMKLKRARTMQLMSNLRTIKLHELNKEQITNVIDWMLILSPAVKTDDKSHSNDDEVTSYILYLLDNINPDNSKFHKYIIKHFEEKARLIHKWVENGRHGDVTKFKG